MHESEIMHSIAYEDNSIRTILEPFPGITDDNPITIPIEQYWPDNSQFKPQFPLSKSSWPDGMTARAHRNNNVHYMRSRGWNEYWLTDGAGIRSGAISANILWPSKDHLEVQFDPVVWKIVNTSRLHGKSDVPELQKLDIQEDKTIDLMYRYIINIDADTNTNHLIFVKLILHEVVWCGDMYRETGKHAYDISYKIDATQIPAYT